MLAVNKDNDAKKCIAKIADTSKHHILNAAEVLVSHILSGYLDFYFLDKEHLFNVLENVKGH